MDQHINCACGWTGVRESLRAGSCPKCMRPASVPYGYPPLPSWKKPEAAQKPATIAPISVTPVAGRWREPSSSPPRWGSLLVMFALVGVCAFSITSLLRRGGCGRHTVTSGDQPIYHKERPRTDRVYVIPRAEPAPEPKYGEAPATAPVPQGTRAEGAKYEDATCQPVESEEK